MKVARLYSYNDIRIEDMPIPEAGDGEALVKVRACGICSGDIMPWYIEKKSPLVIGHEHTGEIVETGNNVKDFKPGSRVFFHHHSPCFACKYCERGDHVQCDTWKMSKIIPGGISEYALIPQVNLQGDTLHLPENVSFKQGTLIEPAACVVKGLKRANIRKGDTVLVMGLGVMGQIHIMLAKECGASKIIGADSVPFRLDSAIESGADTVIDISSARIKDEVMKSTNGDMVDIVVVGPGTVEAMTQGLDCSGRGGRVVFFTPFNPSDLLQFQPNDIYFKDVNIISSYSCGPDDTREALRLISEGIIDSDRLITHSFPLEKTIDAFHITAKAKESLKVIVTM
jgi:L-iditol 2-dehydrogenase